MTCPGPGGPHLAGVDLDGLGVLGLAALSGGLLGLPSRRQPGGLRTHALVCAGAALFCLTGRHLVGEADQNLLRVIQGVAGGIGFIGAAAVLKHDRRIYGVSVAASIWIAGAAGCELALGQRGFALVAIAIITLLNLGLDGFERRLGFRRRLGEDKS